MHIREPEELTVEWLDKLPPDQVEKLIWTLHRGSSEKLRHTWSFFARPDQLAPKGKWRIWLYLAGRGSGKTRAGIEWVREKIKRGAKRVALIAPTASSARDVLIDGESGVLPNAWEHDRDDEGNLMGRPNWSSSRRQLQWANGAIATTYSAEEPDRLRGPQHDCILADELAAWSKIKASGHDASQSSYAWDMAMMGLRIGHNPQAMICTTPRPIPLIRELVKAKYCVVTKATTYANLKNLDPMFFDHIVEKYEGTRLGRQELLGHLLEEMEGALWNREMLEQARDGRHSAYLRVVVAVDPAVSANVSSSLTGILVVARGVDGRAYVLADLSGRYSPDQWARVALGALETYKADRIVAEGNQGGDLVRHTIHTQNSTAPISIVHATRSKQARAEPVVALYEQRKVTHTAAFPELDDQLCTWEPLSGDPSPDRLDALVWALTDLMLGASTAHVIVPPVFFGTPRNIPGQNIGVRPR